MEPKEERRGSRRFNFSWPICVMRASEEVARGQTANISRSGAYFLSEARAELSAGQTVAVRIAVPERAGAGPPRTIDGRARVVRLEEAAEGCGVALHFSEELDALPGADEAGA